MHTSIYTESLRINNSLNVKFKSINCEQDLRMDTNVASKRVPKPSIIGFVKYTEFKFSPLFISYVYVPNSCKKKKMSYFNSYKGSRLS